METAARKFGQFKWARVGGFSAPCTGQWNSRGSQGGINFSRICVYSSRLQLALLT